MKKKILKYEELFFLSEKTILHHQPSSIPSVASQLSKEPTMVDENEGLGFVFIGDIFGNKVNSECASHCNFPLVNTWHPEVSRSIIILWQKFKNREARKCVQISH